MFNTGMFNKTMRSSTLNSKSINPQITQITRNPFICLLFKSLEKPFPANGTVGAMSVRLSEALGPSPLRKPKMNIVQDLLKKELFRFIVIQICYGTNFLSASSFGKTQDKPTKFADHTFLKIINEGCLC
jgi:hypothetical protein